MSSELKGKQDSTFSRRWGWDSGSQHIGAAALCCVEENAGPWREGRAGPGGGRTNAQWRWCRAMLRAVPARNRKGTQKLYNPFSHDSLGILSKRHHSPEYIFQASLLLKCEDLMVCAGCVWAHINSLAHSHFEVLFSPNFCLPLHLYASCVSNSLSFLGPHAEHCCVFFLSCSTANSRQHITCLTLVFCVYGRSLSRAQKRQRPNIEHQTTP